jgi:hypothetical protein
VVAAFATAARLGRRARRRPPGGGSARAARRASNEKWTSGRGCKRSPTARPRRRAQMGSARQGPHPPRRSRPEVNRAADQSPMLSGTGLRRSFRTTAARSTSRRRERGDRREAHQDEKLSVVDRQVQVVQRRSSAAWVDPGRAGIGVVLHPSFVSLSRCPPTGRHRSSRAADAGIAWGCSEDPRHQLTAQGCARVA